MLNIDNIETTETHLDSGNRLLRASVKLSNEYWISRFEIEAHPQRPADVVADFFDRKHLEARNHLWNCVYGGELMQTVNQLEYAVCKALVHPADARELRAAFARLKLLLTEPLPADPLVRAVRLSQCDKVNHG